MDVRSLRLGAVLFIGAVLSGLLLASILLQQECPDCSGTTRMLRENPSQCIEGPAILECPNCGDDGRVSLLKGLLGPAPDPLVASIMRHSNKASWDNARMSDEVAARLKASPLRTAYGREWAPAGTGRARFARGDGKRYVLLVISGTVLLFDPRGTLLDALSVTSQGGASVPTPTFVIPTQADGLCVRIGLLNWQKKPCEWVEIDHVGRAWRFKTPKPREQLDELVWTVQLRDGKLRIVDDKGKSYPE